MDKSNREIFNEIYRHNIWYFGSGTGSVYWLNKPFVVFINNFILSHKDIKTVVDIGCGDWQLGRHFYLDKLRYIGCDVSDEVLNKVKRRYSSKRVTFKRLDVVTDSLPDGDLAIIKDVLQHLSFGDIKRVLSKLKRYKYVIIGNGILEEKFINKDIKNGKFRPLDITKPPFESNQYKLVKIYENGWYVYENILRKLILLPRKLQGVYIRT